MMKYWKFITSCFSCCKRKTKGKLLSSDVPLNHHTYTVRRISSFGRSPSNDDLVKNVDSKTGNGSTMPIPCNRVTLTVQTVNEDMEDCIDSVPDQLDVKHKKRWKKAISISKVHSILRTTSNKKGEQKEKDNNRDGKQTGDDANHERTDITDKNEESDKKIANKEQLKIGSWNKAVSAVQRKKSNCKRSPTISVSSSNNKLYAFYSGSELDVANHSSSLSTTKSSIDLHSMDYLSPCAPRDSTWLKSQSMQDIKSLLADDTVPENSSEVAKAHGIDITLYQNTPISKSAEAVNKARQALDVLGKEDGLQEMAAGTIFFEVEYDESHRKLTVQIEKVSKLAGRGKTKEIYKFVVKLTILPGEKESFSTKKHNLETRIDEQFIFNIKDIYGKVLRFSVFDAQWQKGKYDAVGHALFYIEDVMQPFSKLHQMKLYKQSVPDINPGALQLAMFFNKEKSTVGITVMQVENVNISTGKCKVFVKVMSFSQGHKVKEKCSTPVNYNSESETVFNYTVSFKVDETGMKHNYIVISLKLRSGSIKQDKTIGRLIIGPYFYAEDNATYTPWGKVIICNEMVSNSFRMYL